MASWGLAGKLSRFPYSRALYELRDYLKKEPNSVLTLVRFFVLFS